MMRVYVVGNRPDGVAQARTPIVQVVQMLIRVAKMMILGKKEALEMSGLSETTDEDREAVEKKK